MQNIENNIIKKISRLMNNDKPNEVWFVPVSSVNNKGGIYFYRFKGITKHTKNLSFKIRTLLRKQN